MAKRVLMSFFVAAIVMALSTVTFAQEAKQESKDMKQDKQEMKKDESMKGAKMTGPMYSISCDDACGFMVKSHDEKEVMSVAKNHMKHAHKMSVSDKDLKARMKTEGGDMNK